MTKDMTKEELISRLEKYIAEDPGNHLDAEQAIYPELAGMKFYETPLVGFASAQDDLYYNLFKKEGVIHPEHRTPEDWLSGAKTVISWFLPFTDEIKKSNMLLHDEPYEAGIPQRASVEWIHARIEGQFFMEKVTRYMVEILQEEGYRAVAPAISPEFGKITPYISNWSERHTAYAAGLGTFGLSKGLITKKGMAGRFGSVITDAYFEPAERPYSSPFEYCTMCGACVKRCPAGAIDASKGCALGKDQLVCGPYTMGGRLPAHGPNQRVRYGCGKCQVGVPCMSGIPGRGTGKN